VWAITLSGLAVSHILSAGGVGGWVVTYNALMKHKVPHGIIFVAIAAQQFFNYVVLWFFFAVAIVYLILVRGSDSIIGYLVGIALIGLILAHPVRHLPGHRRPAAPASRSPAWRTGSGVARWSGTTSTAGSTTCSSACAAGQAVVVPHYAVLACAFWFFDMLCLWCTFQAFGYTIGPPARSGRVGHSTHRRPPGLGAVEES
jgi:hypothetical protein